VVRPAGAAEDTARQDDDARHARRLAIDRQTQGCVADKAKGNIVGAGVSAGAARVDPPARLQPIWGRALARTPIEMTQAGDSGGVADGGSY